MFGFLVLLGLLLVLKQLKDFSKSLLVSVRDFLLNLLLNFLSLFSLLDLFLWSLKFLHDRLALFSGSNASVRVVKKLSKLFLLSKSFMVLLHKSHQRETGTSSEDESGKLCSSSVVKLLHFRSLGAFDSSS